MPNEFLFWVKLTFTLTVIALNGSRVDADVAEAPNKIISITESIDTASVLDNYLSQKAIAIAAKNTSLKASEYFISGGQKYNKRDFQGALADYSKAIQLDPGYALAYHARGFIKHRPPSAKFHNFKAALADYNRAIQLDPNVILFYDSRGNLKVDEFKDYQGALIDFNRAIQLDPNYAKVYGNRGELKYNLLNDRAGGIADMQKAAKLFQQQGNNEGYRIAIGNLKKWLKTSNSSRR